jgi:hypothetical protein
MWIKKKRRRLISSGKVLQIKMPCDFVSGGIRRRRILLSIAFVQERKKKKYWKHKYLLFYMDILIAIFLFHQPASTNLLSVRRRERLTEYFAHAFLSVV